MKHSRSLAIIGCGFVADLYMRSLQLYPEIDIAAVWDRDPARLSAFAAHWGAPAAASQEDLVSTARERGALVLNLTNPREHYGVSRAALEAGLDVYSEKPLADEFEKAKALSEFAGEGGRMIGSAPCNFLSESAQLAIAALREGRIGAARLVYAELDDDYIPAAPYRSWASESGAPWPYEDEFEVGCTLEHAGYYLTWLMAAFGSIDVVAAASAEIIEGKPVGDDGAAPDYSAATLFFRSGEVARLTCSIVAPHDHRFRVFGSDGVLSVEDCWRNDAAVRIHRRFTVRRRLVTNPIAERVRAVGETHKKVGRTGAAAMNFALGPVEMLDARAENRPSRVNADFGLHLTEATLAIQNAGRTSAPYQMTTSCPETPLALWAKLRPRRVVGLERRISKLTEA
ncbi:MAG: Gfo/Idh/MocA family oxidoreductase [Pseudomonadota bacterium]